MEATRVSDLGALAMRGQPARTSSDPHPSLEEIAFSRSAPTDLLLRQLLPSRRDSRLDGHRAARYRSSAPPYRTANTHKRRALRLPLGDCADGHMWRKPPLRHSRPPRRSHGISDRKSIDWPPFAL